MAGRGAVFRTFLAVCTALALLAGCGGNTVREAAPFEGRTGNYSASARIRCRGLAALANISRETPSYCSVTFSEPESLAGMELIFSRDTITLTYRGLDFGFEPSSLPAGAAAGLLISSLSAAMSGENISATEDGGLIYLSGATLGEAFSLKLDGETGAPIKLSVPGEEIEIEFEDFRFLD